MQSAAESSQFEKMRSHVWLRFGQTRQARSLLAVVGSVVALAAWLDFSRLQEGHHADSLVPVLTGLTQWTPFFWGQDRFGMLIPLLALPVRDPEAHLLLQGFLVISLSIWGLILLVRTLLPREYPWVPPAALLLVLLLLLAPSDQRFNILWVQPYTLSLSLGLSAVELLRRSGVLRLLGAALFFFAAAWVNIGVGVVVAPLVAWRTCFIDAGRSGLARWRFLFANGALLALASFCSARLSQAAFVPHTVFETLPATAWREAATELLRGAWTNAAIRLWVSVAFGLATVGLLSLFSASVRSEARPSLLAAAGLGLTATLPFAAVSTSSWVAGNGYALRYLIPPLLLFEAACCLLATLPLLALPVARRRVANWASAGAVGVAVLIAVGPPSRQAVVRAFESRWGTRAREVIAARATHVTGDYWKVWPTVFYATWLLGSPGRRDWPYGITDRSIATLKESRAVPHPRVAVLDGRSIWLGLLGAHRWVVTERSSSFLILTEQ
jgi:hypothetical protein